MSRFRSHPLKSHPLRALASLSLAPALTLAVALTSAQAATTSMQQVVSEVHDLYAANGPGIDRNAQSSNTTGSLTTERWRASSTNLGQGGLAHARSDWRQETLIAGTSALARSDGGYNGLAQASLRVMFDIDVVLEGPKDGILLLLWRNQLLDSGCLWDQGCDFNISFLHQTRGRIAYANLSGDREASFSERLTLRAGTAASDPTQSVGGRLQVQLRNLQTTAEISASGDWSVNDLQSFGPTPASQLGLYPGADARNALDDPRGDLQGWTFSHSELLTIPVRFKVLDSTAAALATQLTGRVTAELDQQAIAGSRRFVYSASTLSVDFADTSTFSFAQITDPAGIVDFSQARVSLVAAPVPEPHAAWLALGGLALLWARRRR